MQPPPEYTFRCPNTSHLFSPQPSWEGKSVGTSTPTAQMRKLRPKGETHGLPKGTGPCAACHLLAEGNGPQRTRSADLDLGSPFLGSSCPNPVKSQKPCPKSSGQPLSTSWVPFSELITGGVHL